MEPLILLAARPRKKPVFSWRGLRDLARWNAGLFIFVEYAGRCHAATSSPLVCTENLSPGVVVAKSPRMAWELITPVR
jgi:hypothetical protein